ncbi:hypothetical protein ABZT43_50125, partial [Streptomyces sp. NPDC005349]|uniref:hypothetical protein n=1 Tax=Streptomyces sp. NPDC005349 TaxID=3157037 RepID=UPI0033ACCE40
FFHARDRTRTSVQTITRTAHLERNPVCHNALRRPQMKQRETPGKAAGHSLGVCSETRDPTRGEVKSDG